MGLTDTIMQMMRQSRKRIIDTMRELGITKMDFVMTQEEFAADVGYDNADDSRSDYNDYVSYEAPYIIHFDEYDNAHEYSVVSAELADGDFPTFKLFCKADEFGDEIFNDDRIVALSMVHVYDCMMQKLGIKGTHGKVWAVTQESNVDGQTLTNVTVCRDLETAKKTMNDEIHTLMDEGHYVDYKEWPNDFVLEQTDTSFFIKDNCDDYYEDIQITEKEII